MLRLLMIHSLEQWITILYLWLLQLLSFLLISTQDEHRKYSTYRWPVLYRLEGRWGQDKLTWETHCLQHDDQQPESTWYIEVTHIQYYSHSRPRKPGNETIHLPTWFHSKPLGTRLRLPNVFIFSHVTTCTCGSWLWIVVRAVMMLMVAKHLPKHGSVKLTMKQAYNWGGVDGGGGEGWQYSVVAHVKKSLCEVGNSEFKYTNKQHGQHWYF